ncbi:urease accessory protein UreF [Actinoallomurus sp. NBC_01490]|uniref:urease accessory protein UreF n=1 Tax=Actinoallomurus sp. NBC_01490 TaxID=2903557 RepID=UPI002E32D2F5|nr:urease accessory UreF family protein [Actinoallomurus sp. NBC_01490]
MSAPGHRGVAPDASPAGHAAGLSALLLLADGRFPAGGHAHSGGLEAAVAAGRVTDVTTLMSFLRGRTVTSGAVCAAFAAAACAAFEADPTMTNGELEDLDAELDARTPSPALRGTSRVLGRQLLRAARAIRAHPGLDPLTVTMPDGPHQPIALGVTSAVFQLTPHAAAVAALHEAAAGPATAAIRLLGLDPFAVHAVLIRLAPHLDELAREAADHAATPAERLPAPGAPMLDISAEHHAAWEVRLFAS